MIYIFVRSFRGDYREQHEAVYELLFEKMKSVLDTDASYDDIRKTERGKPYFADIPVKFSVSHCREYILAAFCPAEDGEVGADCETIRPYKENIARKYFSVSEISAARNNDEMFTKLFSLRESYVKYLGAGISSHLRDISFDISGDSVLTDRKDLDFRVFDIAGAVCTVCAGKGIDVEFALC